MAAKEETKKDRSWVGPIVGAVIAGIFAIVVAVINLAGTSKNQSQAGTTTTTTQASASTTASSAGSAGKKVVSGKQLTLPSPGQGCMGKAEIDFDTMKVAPNVPEIHRETADLSYQSCTGIMVVEGGMAQLDTPPSSAEDCAQASETNPLRNPITHELIRNEMPLVKGKHLCLKTKLGKIVHLAIDEVTPVAPDGSSLPPLKDYAFTVDVWEP
ncbi:hypothetical protein FKR81_07035 [Lentzea tibetensis]|uniref:Uncharacterized protein n=1 Tax=Lentzea tibetensis TaxID=2591470 RepID=A0A563EYT6_9PSEU|nr:hypothetical protein [Lentzea tibetensis]TWP52866.1 hypothetical protein FKR81_07035 [Lentzea tibetensis]